MTIWLYMLAAVCGAGSAFILATVIAVMAPLGLWPTLASLSVFVAGAALASALWAIRYDHLSREMMKWHIEQIESVKGRVPEMMNALFRKMKAEGLLPEGLDFQVGEPNDGNPDKPDKPAPDKKLN